MKCSVCKKVVVFRQSWPSSGVVNEEEKTMLVKIEKGMGEDSDYGMEVKVFTCPHCETILGIVPSGTIVS